MEKELLRSKKGKQVTIIGFWGNALLTVCKIYAGLVGKSGAMLADGIHSLSDFLTDIVVLVGFKLTEQPEDDCHNYGHDKYETLATAIISLFLAIVGFEILKSGVSSILLVIRGEKLSSPGIIALVAAIVSIGVKELLYRYTLKVGKEIESNAVIANAWHHRSDAFSSIGTLFGIGGAIVLGEKWAILDPIASVVVSLFIFKVSYEILKPALDELMECSLSQEERIKIVNILDNCEEVKGYHHLRSRRLGAKAVVEFHIFVESTLDIKSAHDIATEIEMDMKKEFGDLSVITIHIEPFEE